MKIVTPGKDYPLSCDEVIETPKGSIFEGNDDRYYYKVSYRDKDLLICLNDDSAYGFDESEGAYIRTLYFRTTSFSSFRLS